MAPGQSRDHRKQEAESDEVGVKSNPSASFLGGHAVVPVSHAEGGKKRVRGPLRPNYTRRKKERPGDDQHISSRGRRTKRNKIKDGTH